MKSTYSLILLFLFSITLQAKKPIKPSSYQSPTATVLNDCIGEAGQVNWLYWENITGGTITNLYENPNYPTLPDYSKILTELKAPVNYFKNFGATITGFIKPSETGAYTFNMTGDDEGYFFLSTNDDPTNLVQHCSFLEPTEVTSENHDKFPSQTSANLTLTAGVYYYFEVHYRQGNSKDKANVYWKTPSNSDWTIVSKDYLYSNACGLICQPEGSPCNDFNPNTINDVYDANCECVGTPCVGVDCGLDLVYTAYDACDATEKLSQNPADSWTSCQETTSPNVARGNGHWIQYDFGQSYTIESSQIWNYNIAGQTNKGFQQVVIDYSNDGVSWTQLGTYNWAQADGLVGYTGFAGPDFTGINTQYILITALSNWGASDCSGFSQIAFHIGECANVGLACDDGDPSTVQDNFNINCECQGVGAAENNCSETTLTHANEMLLAANYDVLLTIASAGMIMNATKVNYVAGESITLMPGFQAQAGSDFLATILPCSTTLEEENVNAASKIGEATTASINEATILTASTTQSVYDNEEIVNTPIISLVIMPNPTNSLTTATFTIPQTGKTSLCIYSSNGQLVTCLSNKNTFQKGVHAKQFPAQQLAKGMYYMVLKTEQEVVTKNFVVIE